MTDALIDSLSEAHGVRVISRQSVMRFKRSSEALPQIAWKLGVDLVVHGSVMRVGNRVRITAQLIRAHPEQQIWARSYERDFRDALGLQADIAREIAGEIQLRIEPGERRRRAVARTVNPEAYDAYLRGYFALNQRTNAGLATAREAFMEALRQDASFSLAHSGLAELYCIDAQFGLSEPAAAYRQARFHAQHALELDPDLADAHVSLGLVHLYADHDWDASEASFGRAIALRPSQPEVHHYYAIHLLSRDRFKEGAKQLRLFLELDPLSPSANVNMGLVAYLEGRPDEALRLFNKAQTLAPDFHPAYLKLSDFYRLRQDESKSYENFRKNLGLRYPKIVPAVDLAQGKHGRKAALEAAAKALEDEIAVNRSLPPEDIARVYVRLDDRRKALDCLEESFRRGFPGALLFGATERWDWNTLRNEKRFQDLVQRIRSSRFPHGLSPSPRPPAAGCSKSAAQSN
jgi:adenylate cyclase